MSHTYHQLLIHVVFSTKNRLPHLFPEVRPRLFAYMGGITRQAGAVPIQINGVWDHVHLLVRIPPSLAISDLLRLVKANSSKWAHETFPEMKGFSWQTGFGAFSVSKSGEQSVNQYIVDQENRHKDMSFQEEYIEFLKRHEIEFDPSVLWE